MPKLPPERLHVGSKRGPFLAPRHAVRKGDPDGLRLLRGKLPKYGPLNMSPTWFATRSKRRAGWASLLLLATLPLGCGDEPQPQPGYMPPPTSTLVEQGQVAIRREVFLVAAPSPAPNPLLVESAATPPQYNFVRVVRYRVDTGTEPPRPARAIMLLMPGFLGGAGSFDPLARALVRRSLSDGAIEAWAIDRRSNLLEDQHGLDVAEVKQDPELARRYYFTGDEIEGRRYAGVRPQDELAFVSEWGLKTTVEDLRAVVRLIPQAERRARLFLLGHSLGASIVEQYAAWDFAGTAGYSELAGLVLVDGRSGIEGSAKLPFGEDDYVNGVTVGSFGRVGLSQIRQNDRYFVLPLLGGDVYPVTAISALRAAFSPTEIVSDPDRDVAMRVLIGRRDLPPMTNRAIVGFAFDESSCNLSFASVSCGQSVGGPLEEYSGVLGAKLLRPADPTATYDWQEPLDDAQATTLGDLAKSWFSGPSLDFAEWYFPVRLTLDAMTAGTLTMKETDWPVARFGLRALHGAKLDLPIYALATQLAGKGAGDPQAFESLRSLVSAVPIGPGRPLAGTPRSESAAFTVRADDKLTHIDPLMGHDRPGSRIQGFYQSLVEFMQKSSPHGGIVIQVAPTPPAVTPATKRSVF